MQDAPRRATFPKRHVVYLETKSKGAAAPLTTNDSVKSVNTFFFFLVDTFFFFAPSSSLSELHKASLASEAAADILPNAKEDSDDDDGRIHIHQVKTRLTS